MGPLSVAEVPEKEVIRRLFPECDIRTRHPRFINSDKALKVLCLAAASNMPRQ